MSMNNSIQTSIEQKLKQAFSPQFLEVRNESHLHAGHHHEENGHHAIYDGTGETHFRVIVVSDKFTDLSRIARHRAINEVLKDELNNGVHALALEPTAPGEPTRRK